MNLPMSGEPSRPAVEPIGVLFLVRALHTGGAERQLALLATAMHLRGIPVAVAVYEDRGGFQSELVRAGIPVHVLGGRGRWDILGLSWHLGRLVRTLRPRVMHAYMSHSNLLVLLLKPVLGMKRVVCGVRSSGLALATYPAIARWGEGLHRRMLRRADLVICNSQAGQQELIASGVDSAHCIHVPNGIDTALFRRDMDARRQLRDEWNIAADVPVVGLVGRLHPMKNHAALLRAVAHLVGQSPLLRLACVGEGDREYRHELLRLADELGISERILWAGRHQDMAAVYSALDVLCLPSAWGEGFPNVIGEAMSCGLPCVASDVGDTADIIGECGWVIPPDDQQALVDALGDVLSKLPTWNPELPRSRVVQQFSVERLVDATIAALGLTAEGNRQCAA